MMSYEFLENPEILDLFYKARQAYGSNYSGIEGVMNYSENMFINVLTMLVSMGIIFILNPLVIFIIIILVVIHTISRNKMLKLEKKEIYDKMYPLWRRFYYTLEVHKDFHASKDIRLYNMEELLVKNNVKESENLGVYLKKQSRYWINYALFANGIILLMELASYGYLIYQVISEGLSIADFTLYLGAIRTLFDSLMSLAYNLNEINRCSLQINDYRKFMEIEDPNYEIKYKIDEIKRFAFEFKNVSFKYPTSDNYALKNFNLTINDHERLAVVGTNGAGKSTLIKLMTRLYEPTSGEIYIDGKNIRNFDRGEYYSLFAPLFQEINLFAYPFSQNISMTSTLKDNKEEAIK